MLTSHIESLRQMMKKEFPSLSGLKIRSRKHDRRKAITLYLNMAESPLL